MTCKKYNNYNCWRGTNTNCIIYIYIYTVGSNKGCAYKLVHGLADKIGFRHKHVLRCLEPQTDTKKRSTKTAHFPCQNTPTKFPQITLSPRADQPAHPPDWSEESETNCLMCTIKYVCLNCLSQPDTPSRKPKPRTKATSQRFKAKTW